MKMEEKNFVHIENTKNKISNWDQINIFNSLPILTLVASLLSLLAVFINQTFLIHVSRSLPVQMPPSIRSTAV